MIRLAIAGYVAYRLGMAGHPYLGVIVVVGVIVWMIRHYNDTHFAPFGIGRLW